MKSIWTLRISSSNALMACRKCAVRSSNRLLYSIEHRSNYSMMCLFVWSHLLSIDLALVSRQPLGCKRLRYRISFVCIDFAYHFHWLNGWPTRWPTYLTADGEDDQSARWKVFGKFLPRKSSSRMARTDESPIWSTTRDAQWWWR